MDVGHGESLELNELNVNDLESQAPTGRRPLSVRWIWRTGASDFPTIIDSQLLTKLYRIIIKKASNVATLQSAHGHRLRHGEA